jgi:superfamily II DNA helicase RecQ
MERYLVNNRIPKDPEANLIHFLEKVFKIKDFRGQQKEIVLAAKQKKDVFVCMPTGGGKSLTFQLPAVTDPGTTIVIMPLLSLIRDQVTRLKELGVQAVSLSGSLTSIINQNINREFCLK